MCLFSDIQIWRVPGRATLCADLSPIADTIPVHSQIGQSPACVTLSDKTIPYVNHAQIITTTRIRIFVRDVFLLE